MYMSSAFLTHVIILSVIEWTWYTALLITFPSSLNFIVLTKNIFSREEPRRTALKRVVFSITLIDQYVWV